MARRGWKEELQIKKVAELATNVIVKALVAPVSEDWTERDKTNLAAQIYGRMIPRDLRAQISTDVTFKLIKFDVIENATKEVISGSADTGPDQIQAA